MKPLLLKMSDRIISDEVFAFIIVDSEVNILPRLHSHDFSEIFWVTSGSAQHLVNGVRETVLTGDLRILYGTDVHQLIPHKTGRFTFCNLALPSHWLSGLITRHKSRLTHLLHASKSRPHTFSLHPRDQAILSGESVRLLSRTRDSLSLETFLCFLLGLLVQTPHSTINKAPYWLMEACVRIEEPEFLSQGVQGFVQACRRGHEYVSRSTRRYLGKRPIDIVNESRIRLARRLMAATSLPVLEVALQCGFSGPAQFYQMFHQSIGESPVAFRRRMQIQI